MPTDNLDAAACRELVALAESAEQTIARLRSELATVREVLLRADLATNAVSLEVDARCAAYAEEHDRQCKASQAEIDRLKVALDAATERETELRSVVIRVAEVNSEALLCEVKLFQPDGGASWLQSCATEILRKHRAVRGSSDV